MLLIRFLIIMMLGLTSVLACNPRVNPHSFSCQDKTFNGQVFPLFDMNTRLLDRIWFSNQFTPQNSNDHIFRSLHSRSSRHRTCGIANSDGTRMGILDPIVRGNGIQDIEIESFLGGDFITGSKPYFEDRKSVAFGNDGGANLFRCRVFDRVDKPHLLCQYFKDGQMRGYLGFLPSATSCK
jgi:hypothetical protein